MEASEDGIKSEAQNQMPIRSAKAAILLSSLNRQLRSLTNNQRDHQICSKRSDGNEVVKLKREVEDLKIELVREKSKSKKIDRGNICMKFLLLQISCFILTLVFSFVFFARVYISVTLE